MKEKNDLTSINPNENNIANCLDALIKSSDLYIPQKAFFFHCEDFKMKPKKSCM